MNDFTKEELIKLYQEMKFIVEEYADPDDMEIGLKDKLQSMIDNYCEHESLDFVGDVFGYDCKKCDKRFDYNHVGNERHERIIRGEE